MGRRLSGEEVIKHVIVERWRNVERPLDHEQRMYKAGKRTKRNSIWVIIKRKNLLLRPYSFQFERNYRYIYFTVCKVWKKDGGM